MEEKNGQTHLPEKRRHSRVGKQFIIRYEKLDDLHLNKDSQPGELIDIGGGGALFRTSEWLETDTPLVMTLDLYGWSPDVDQWLDSMKESEVGGVLKLLAMVVRVEFNPEDNSSYIIGVRFSGNLGNSAIDASGE
ncbi:PilZ domain-containing protein [Thermodesulfobacteriota bacterium]